MTMQVGGRFRARRFGPGVLVLALGALARLGAAAALAASPVTVVKAGP